MEEKRKPGRPPGLITYSDVTYNSRDYIVGTLISNGEIVKFVFDKDDYDKVKGKSWHRAANAYISHGVIVDGKKKELYLHNVVMNRLDHTGKGSTETVDHISRNGLDNRKENLRILTQTEQNLNQKRKGRKVELPEDSGLTVEDLPKHIWYIKPNGHHGERFGIDLKTEGIQWKTTSSKSVTLQDKLHAAKEKLAEFYKLYPRLNPENDETTFMIEGLVHSYEEILRLSDG
jgi:hypothetical protein